MKKKNIYKNFDKEFFFFFIIINIIDGNIVIY